MKITFEKATQIILDKFNNLNISLISPEVLDEKNNVIYKLNTFKIHGKDIINLYDILDNTRCFVEDEIILSSSLRLLDNNKLSISYKKLNTREFSFLIGMYKREIEAQMKKN